MTDLEELRKRYCSALTEDILPFWLEHGLDRKNGGIWTGVAEDGTLIESDKSVWFQGRALWTFSTAYLMTGRKEYLEAASVIAPFIDANCTDSDGRMFFRVTADGRPVQKRLRYVYSECFALMGYAAYSRATGNAGYKEKAIGLWKLIYDIIGTPGILIPKFDPSTEPSIAFGPPMIFINMLSELRKACQEKDEEITLEIRRLIAYVEKYFVRDDMRLVLEQVAPDGTFMREHNEGRICNPGHAIEASWFIMNEGIYEKRKDYVDLGLKILDWEWELGWDREYGGIIQYRDALGLPLSEYHSDMKFWWPQTEAAIANLMAYTVTGKERFLSRFLETDRYITEHFADRENGEWYGYLHRDGTLSTTVKGNMYKGPFHIPRMYMVCLSLLDTLRD